MSNCALDAINYGLTTVLVCDKCLVSRERGRENSKIYVETFLRRGENDREVGRTLL
jgi:hypothetical protein